MRGGLRLAALSIDLDEIPAYHAIHGFGPAPADCRHAVYDAALPRIERFAHEHALPVTLFAVGSDLARDAAAAALRRFHGLGHAVENHTQNHRYDLTRLDPAEIRREVSEGARAIERATGRAPRGFRAPGYTITDALLDVLEDLGVAYDSSVFPCPAYYGAKALVLGGYRMLGQPSASVLDNPRVLAAPRTPYRPGTRYHRRGARRLIELPIQVTPKLRLPLIGTSIGQMGSLLARRLVRDCALAGDALVNLELHGIDFLDLADGLGHLGDRQPELRTALVKRTATLGAVVAELRELGYRFVRLDEAADALAAEL
jgi:peptidoglycan-N-acetylglucosamine deacetylase